MSLKRASVASLERNVMSLKRASILMVVVASLTGIWERCSGGSRFHPTINLRGASVSAAVAPVILWLFIVGPDLPVTASHGFFVGWWPRPRRQC